MKAVPVDVMKMDKKFIEGLPQEHGMADAIIQLAESLSLEVVAEGVETQAQRDWLASAGVSLAQGYLFGKAATAQAFEQRYISRTQEPD